MRKNGIAWLFGGQGQGTIQQGMGKEVFARSRKARLIIETADLILGRPLSKLCFEGPEEELFKTVNSQLASLVMNLAHAAVFCEIKQKNGDLIFIPRRNRPMVLAGNSVGYIAALVCSGCITFFQAIQLVTVRATLMAAACRQNPSRMLVLIDPAISRVEKRCLDFGVQVSNYNSDSQIILSGLIGPMAEMEEVILLENLARRLLPMETEGGFHSKCMKPAEDLLADFVKLLPFNEPNISIIGNSWAQIITTGSEAKQELVEQLCSAVRWLQSMETIDAMGVTTSIEMCGDVLSKNLSRGRSWKTFREFLSSRVALARHFAKNRRKHTSAPLSS